MKLFVAVNSMLSDVDRGIQAGHAIAGLVYALTKADDPILHEWIIKHQTIVYLDGGRHPNMVKLKEILTREEVVFYYFTEPAANDMLTAIAWIEDKHCPSKFMTKL